MLKKFAKEVALYGSADLLFRATQFAALPVYAHYLSIKDFAVMALLTTTAMLLGILINLGINNAVQRFYFDPDVKETQPLLVSTGLAQLTLTGVAVSGLTVLLLLHLVDTRGNVYGIPFALAAITVATLVPDQIAQYLQDVARLHFAPNRFIVISLVRNLLGVVIGLVLLVEWQLGVSGILLGVLTGATLAVPVGIILTRKDLQFNFDRRLVGRVFRYGYPFVFMGAAFWVFGSLDRWMLLELSNVTQVGLFSIAIKFAAVLAFITFAFGRAWHPLVFKLFNEDPSYPLIYSQVLSAWFLLLSLVALSISLFAGELFRVLTPIEYWSAAPVLSIALAALALEGTTHVTTIGITLERRTIRLTQGAWMAAVTNVGLNVILIPPLGAVGAAVATLFSYAMLTGSFLFWSQRLHPIPLDWLKLLYSLAIVTLTASAPLLFGGIPGSLGVTALKIALILAGAAGGVIVGIIDLALLGDLITRSSETSASAPSGELEKIEETRW